MSMPTLYPEGKMQEKICQAASAARIQGSVSHLGLTVANDLGQILQSKCGLRSTEFRGSVRLIG